MKRIIDSRKKEKFMIDDEYLNGQAKLCGWQATIVYLSLCRHANKNQESFPSIKLMAEENAVSRDTIMRGLSKLEERNLIKIKKMRSKNGKWLNNTYILLDKSLWVYSQVAHSNTDNNPSQVAHSNTPSRSQRPIQVAHSDTKETHSEGNTYKETHIIADKSASNINLLLNEFKDINPTINFGNKTQRKVCEELIKQFGLEKTLNTIAYYKTIKDEKFSPVITTPYQLKEKMGQLIAFYNKSKDGGSVAILND